MKYYFLALATLVAVCVGCQAPGDPIGKKHFRAPPPEMMVRPGPMVDGPGPGVMSMMGAPPPRTFATSTTQLRFLGPEGMQIGWQIPGGYAENQLIAPGRYNFRQGSSYRLKLTGIPEREGVTLYPTLQVYPAHPQTDAYLAHNSVPLQITDEDLDQVESNNFVTKVIYLPSPRHQELAIAGVETLVSTRLDPGIDPVAEASRRGTIMAVLRIGNMNLETANAPPVGLMGGLQQVSHTRHVNGQTGELVSPMPIEQPGAGGPSIPPAMIMGVPGGAGQPAYNPVAGMGPAPTWGMPTTGTPIGLPGPPHLPYGAPAGLKSHTVRNKTRQQIPDPVDHFLIDVKHKPGIKLPEPVEHVKYKEVHPILDE